MKKRLFIIFMVGIPAITGFLIWLVSRIGWLPDYVIYLRVSFGLTILVLGLVLTALFLTRWIVATTIQQRSQKKLADIRARTAQQHRHFLRRLDHELKNPLTAMQIEVANLVAEMNQQTEISSNGSQFVKSQALPRIREQMTRMSDLLIQLRKLGELESHQIEREPVRIDELLLEIVEEYQTSESGDSREITLSLPQIPWPLPEIQGDADLLYLSIRNLLSNAVKFTNPGDAIQLRAFEDSSQVVVEIADSGPGIPEDELPFVWDELYRGKLAQGLPGSGLGLPIVKAIIERHNGQVNLRSRVDKGTVVTMRLPL